MPPVLTCTSCLTVLVKEDDNGNIKVEGQYIPSPNLGRLVKCEGEDEAAPSCPLCALNLDVKHTVRLLGCCFTCYVLVRTLLKSVLFF